MDKKIKIELIGMLLFLILVLPSIVFSMCLDDAEIIDNFVSFTKSPIELNYNGLFILENTGNTSHSIKVEFKGNIHEEYFDDLTNTTIRGTHHIIRDITNCSSCHYRHNNYICKSPVVLNPGEKIGFRIYHFPANGVYEIYVNGTLIKIVTSHIYNFECGNPDSSIFWFYEYQSCPSGICDIKPSFNYEKTQKPHYEIQIYNDVKPTSAVLIIFLIILSPFLILSWVLRHRIKCKYVILLGIIVTLFVLYIPIPL